MDYYACIDETNPKNWVIFNCDDYKNGVDGYKTIYILNCEITENELTYPLYPLSGSVVIDAYGEDNLLILKTTLVGQITKGVRGYEEIIKKLRIKKLKKLNLIT